MSDGMVFILHAVADEKYAVALARALAPLTAIPTALAENGARGVQLGGGSASLVIWTKSTGACAEAALTALPHGSAALCVPRGVVAPEALRARALRLVEISGDAARDAEAVRETISTLHAQLRARNLDNSRRRGSVAPRLASAGAQASEATAARKSPMVMRSAVGLGATLAVVGVIAPNITNRAQATDVADAAAALEAVPAATLQVLPAVPQAEIGEADAEAVSDDPLMMLTAYNEPVAPTPPPQLFQAYAPRSISFVTAREAAAPLASLTEIDAELGEAVAAAWREAKKGPTQTASAEAADKRAAILSVADQALGE
jgi:hypothetical protein